MKVKIRGPRVPIYEIHAVYTDFAFISSWISIFLWCFSIFSMDFVWEMDFDFNFDVNFNLEHGFSVFVYAVNFDI